MRVVLDTNVIISGLLWKKNTKALFDLVDKKQIKICLSPKIITEILRVLKYPHIKKQLDLIKLSPNEIISYLKQISEIYPDIKIAINLSDSSDRIFLGVAVKSKAKYLVSGDKHLLSLKQFQGIKILMPKEFLKEIK